MPATATTPTPSDVELALEKLSAAVLAGCREKKVITALKAYLPKIPIDFEAEPSIYVDGQMLPFHEGQSEVWIAEWRIIAVFAGWQSGKTTIGPFWLRREIYWRGAGTYAVISPHAPLLKSSALPQLKAVFCEPLWTYSGADGGSFTMTPLGELAYFGQLQRIRTVILTRHAQKADAIESWTAKGIWVDEPGQIANNIWVAIQARAMAFQARILLTSRPYEFNWYVTDIWNACMVCYGDPDVDEWVRRPDAPADTGVVNFSTADSPNPNNRLEYERQKRKMPPWEHRRKYDGIPTRPAGLVYSSFTQVKRADRASNVCSFEEFFPGGIPREWPIWVGIDFGKVHTAFVLIAEEMRMNPIGEWKQLANPRFCIFKTYQSEKQEDPLEHMKQAFRGFGQPVEIVNHRGQTETVFQLSRGQIFAFGGSLQETAWRTLYAKHGLDIGEPAITGSKGVDAQIQTVWSAFNSGRLLVCDHEAELIKDLETFSTELDEETNEPTEKLKDEEKFHRLAGLRYIVPCMPFDDDGRSAPGSNMQSLPVSDPAPAESVFPRSAPEFEEGSERDFSVAADRFEDVEDEPTVFYGIPSSG